MITRSSWRGAPQGKGVWMGERFSVREEVHRPVVDGEIPPKPIATSEDIARAGLDISSSPEATGIVVVLDGGRIL